MAGKTEQLHTVRERLGRTADGRIVPWLDPECAFLAYRPGDLIPTDEARAAGLLGRIERKEAAPAEDKMAARAADKAVKIPPATARDAGAAGKGKK